MQQEQETRRIMQERAAQERQAAEANRIESNRRLQEHYEAQRRAQSNG